MNPKIVRVWPKLVQLLCLHHSAWIVGSAADPQKLDPKDIDVIVPWAEWPKVAHQIPKDARPNMFGGWKFVVDGVEVDVWPDTLDRLAATYSFVYAWHMASNTLIHKAERMDSCIPASKTRVIGS